MQGYANGVLFEQPKHAHQAKARPINKHKCRETLKESLGNAKGVLIEQPEEPKHAQPAKGQPINKKRSMETLKEWALGNHKGKNMQNQLKDGR